MEKECHAILKEKMDFYAHGVYTLTRKFPKEELYGVTSQLRRSALSVILNYIEGFARKREKVMKNFFDISYGSLKESKYLLYFSYKENYLGKDEYEKIVGQAEEIGKMLWAISKDSKD